MFNLVEYIKKYNFVSYPVLAYFYLWMISNSKSDFILLAISVVLAIVSYAFVKYNTENLVQKYNQGRLKKNDINLVKIMKTAFDLKKKISWAMMIFYIITFGFYLFSFFNVYNQMVYPYGYVVFLVGLGVLAFFISIRIFYNKESKEMHQWIQTHIKQHKRQ